MKQLIVVLLSTFFNIYYAIAEDSQIMPTPPTQMEEPSATQQWLELQRSGRSASSQAQPSSGEVMDRVHKRYLKSFEKPIPEFYEHDTSFTR